MSECEGCAAKDATIAELIKALRAQPQVVTIFKPAQPDAASVPSVYDRCPCNPKNGGSGICGCVRAGMSITATVPGQYTTFNGGTS